MVAVLVPVLPGDVEFYGIDGVPQAVLIEAATTEANRAVLHALTEAGILDPMAADKVAERVSICLEARLRVLAAERDLGANLAGIAPHAVA